MKSIYLTILFLVVFLGSFAQKASVKGHIIDGVSNEPLPFVNVVVAGTTVGTISDEEGHFKISGLQPGFIRLEASFIGYDQILSPEIEVSNASVAHVDIRMEKSDTRLQEVTVTASPFRKRVESPVSLKTIGISEIENSPGANRDISRVIQSFAGVLSTPAYRNDIIIRGGGPSESRFYLDGVEVPNINHFATQGASGGPVGILNADLLREVNYYSGAFPSNRGNALSGVLEFYQVDGNEDRLKFRGSLGASEVSATFDGPIGGKTTFIVSARRSYLKLLFSALELPFLPTFNDIQFKSKTRFDEKNEITIIGLGAIDLFDLNLDIKDPDEQQKYILSEIPVYEQWSYTVGAVYKHYREKSYQTLVFSRSHLSNVIYKYFENDDRSEDNKIFDYHSEEIENKIRLENMTRIGNYKINLGASLDFARYTNATIQQRYFGSGIQEINYDALLDLVKWGIFGQLSHGFMANRLSVSAGFRMDANNYSSTMENMFNQFSPRVSASFQFNEKWSINANMGRYYQLPSYTTLGFQQNDLLVNKQNGLKYISVDHLIGGLEFRPNSSILFSIETFYKKYKHYPFSVNDSISLANRGADYGVVGDEEVVSVSAGRAYGTEFQARIQSTKGFNLNLSYTWVTSEFQNANRKYIPSSWDSKHLLVLTSVKKLKRDWQLGIRWRYVGGLPYTPYDMGKSELVEAWNLKGGPYLDNHLLNTERFSPFHQLDLRVDKAYYLKKMTFKIYLDIQNLYNFQSQSNDIIVREEENSGNYITTDNGTKYVLRRVDNTTGSILPTIGLMIEF